MYHGNYCAGITAYDATLIQNCFNTGTINGRSYGSGITTNGTLIYNCYNTGEIVAPWKAGIAYNLKGNMVNCYCIDKGDTPQNRAEYVLVHDTVAGTEPIIANCFYISDTNIASKRGGIVWNNKGTLTMYNCYALSERYVGNFNDALIRNNTGTVELHKCYYLKTQYITQAVRGLDDADLDVEGVNSVSEITAAKLNANLSSIPDLGEDVELLEWIDGPDGYPILNLQLPLSTESTEEAEET